MTFAVSRLFLVSYVALWILVLVLVVLCLALAQQIGLLNVRLPPLGGRTVDVGAEIGSDIDARVVETVDGRPVRIGGPAARPMLVIALSATCSVCADAAVALRSIARSRRGELDILLIGLTDSPIAMAQFVKANKLERFDLTVDPELRAELGLRTAPYGMVLDEHGAVRAKGIVNHLEHLEGLVTDDQRTNEQSPVAPIARLGRPSGRVDAPDEGALM
jgi:methylamine dehydrogenase accessory protein MauD